MSEVPAAAETAAGSGDPPDVDVHGDVDDAGPTPVARTRWGGAVAVGVPSTVLGLHSASYGQWIVDDAGITFAYARSLATGAGPVLQPGAPAVEGYSDPAWLALLVAAHRLGLFDHGTWFGVPDLVALPKVLGWLCGVGVFLCFLAAARAVSDRPVVVATVAGVVTAVIPSFAIWTTSGLENGLLALAVVAHRHRHRPRGRCRTGPRADGRGDLRGPGRTRGADAAGGDRVRRRVPRRRPAAASRRGAAPVPRDRDLVGHGGAPRRCPPRVAGGGVRRRRAQPCPGQGAGPAHARQPRSPRGAGDLSRAGRPACSPWW